MARALELACAERPESTRHDLLLREELLDGILSTIPGAHLNGDRARRVPNNVNVSFEGVHGESLLVALDLAGIMASSGSACTSGSLEPSHVLQAIGLPDRLVRSSLRLTVGRGTTSEDVRRTLEVTSSTVERLRRLSTAATRA
jgi:cysteine desulfurase